MLLPSPRGFSPSCGELGYRNAGAPSLSSVATGKQVLGLGRRAVVCFPDDFIVTGSWKAATRQLGNAVPTTIGESIGGAIIKLLRRKQEKRSLL
jgi:hypothetical protein